MQRGKKKSVLRTIFCMAMWLFIPIGMQSVSAQPDAMRVTLNLQSVTVKEFFNDVKKQTGMSFMYSVEQVKDIAPISFRCQNRPVKQVLDEVLGTGSYTYNSEENIVTVNPLQRKGGVKNSFPE